jgi:signal transduction histidine kinase
MQAGVEMRVRAAAVAAAFAVSLVGVAVSLWAHAADAQPLVPAAALSAAVVAAFAFAGALVASARPSNPVGWLMLAGAAAWALGNGAVDVAYRGLVAAPGAVPAASGWAVAGSAVRGLGWSLVTVGVAMVFPDGRVLGGRWRWLPRLLIAAVAANTLAVVAEADANVTGLGGWRNPVALPAAWQPLAGLLSLVAILLGAVVTVAAAIQLFIRWRRGGLLERQQLTLYALGVAVVVVVAPLEIAGVAGAWLFSAAALPLPVAIAFAVLARGLYDLRTATNRTLVWLTLSAAVVGLYALVIAGVGAELRAGGAGWLPWVAAAVVAVSFAPLRDLLQRAVNRLTFGRFEEPYEVLAELGQRLRASADVGRLLDEAVLELHELGLQEVGMHDLRGELIAGEHAATHAAELPLAAYGERVGTLRYRQPAMPLRTRERRLLEDLTGHLGGVLHAHRLTVELQRALERLVLAREEERRRLRRDLHDGLGPALASHLLRLDLLALTLEQDPRARADLDALRDELRATVLDVRRLVEGLRPPALDELGLAGAIAQTAERLTAGASLEVELDADELPPLPAAIEVAAYRIVSEALTNVVRHAHATRCNVTIGVDDRRLRIVIADNGRGAAPDVPLAGHGLQTMRERAEELRGRLSLRRDQGTTVVAELPLPPTQTGAARAHAEAHS